MGAETWLFEFGCLREFHREFIQLIFWGAKDGEIRTTTWLLEFGLLCEFYMELRSNSGFSNSGAVRENELLCEFHMEFIQSNFRGRKDGGIRTTAVLVEFGLLCEFHMVVPPNTGFFMNSI